MMKIRRTTVSDLCQVMEMISQAKAYFKSQKIDQWQNGYPNDEIIMQDISNQTSYVLEEHDKIIATMCLSFDADSNYEDIEGEWLCNERYGVIHRIVVEQEYKGKRVADALLNYTLEECHHRKAKSIRVDTHENNLSMQHFLVRNGFTKCGVIYIDGVDPRFAYEKVV